MTMMPLGKHQTAENTGNRVEKADEKFGFFLSDVQGVVHDNAAIMLPILWRLSGYWKRSTELHHINVQAIHFSLWSTMPLRRIPN